MRLRFALTVSTVIGLLLASSPVLAFTGGAPSSTPPKAGDGAAKTAPAGLSKPPAVPESVAAQAELQKDGYFGDLIRPESGGMIQEVWDYSDRRHGTYVTPACEDCVYKVRLREFMVTTIILPSDAEIEAADLGDAAAFQVQVRGSNKVAVRPAGYGMDTNLNIYTRRKVYSFYLRAEGFNSQNHPDLTVRITGTEAPPDLSVSVPVSTAAATPRATGEPLSLVGLQDAAVKGLENPKPDKGDFVRTIQFDPSALHGFNDYSLSGDPELKPLRVFRDNQFTYIQYDKQWDSTQLPTAYVVYDGIDEEVNTRVKGGTYIIEAVDKKIVLKSGKKFLCITYEGGN